MENMKDKIIRKSGDAIRRFDDGRCSVTLRVSPYADKQVAEVIDTVYYKKGYRVPYHYSDRGSETFLILKGKVEVILYGKSCECEAGDYINIPSHCPYGLETLEDGCEIRGIFTDINIASRYTDLELLRKNASSGGAGADNPSEAFNAEHHYFALTEPVDVVKTDKKSLPQITPKNSAIYEYGGWKGIRCLLKVGRWNLKRVKEIWEFTIDKGCQLQYSKPNANERLYAVQSGRVKIDVFGETLFADENDLIHIPPYTRYTITAMADKTVIQDLNVSSRLFRMLEMLQLAQRDEPEKPADAEWMKWLLELNECNLTGFVLTA